ncbi:cytochrome P450 monooxygenase [Phakopsora pachyrhizi]|uniref:Cytochrome P450 monooxygenase n=1 Tax=Phakopsora pachyrhizi TaxID=170000 RepID=A0AAV0BFC2_PHAPC|nr:cytochrome P450 monooxygenase [Phakopsora pachyrhizi]
MFYKTSFFQAFCFSFLTSILISGWLTDRLRNQLILLKKGSDVNLSDRLIIFSTVYLLTRLIRLQVVEFNLRRRAKFKSSRLPPVSISRLPFGISFSIDKLRTLKFGQPGDLLKFFKGLKTSSKVVRFRSYGIESLLTIDPRDSHYMLSNGFSNFGKSPHTQAAFKRLLGDGVFTSDQRSLWAWHRHMTRPHFSRDRIEDFEAVEFHCQRIVNWFIKQSDSDRFLNIQDVFSRFTLTVGTHHLFGRCVDSLNGLIKDSDNNQNNYPFDTPISSVTTLRVNSIESFAKNFFAAQSWALVHAIIPPFLRWLHPRDKSTDKVLEVVESIIREAQQMSSNEKIPSPFPKIIEPSQVLPEISKPSINNNLLDHLLNSGCSIETVRHECMNILLAATDTTSSLLTSCIFELGKMNHRFFYLKLKEEIHRIVGEPDVFGDLNLQKVREMKFLRAVINETLRLHPPVWANTRHSFEDDVLPSGHFIPAGTDCRFGIREMQRDPEVWGPDAEVFDPLRWIDDRKKVLVREPFCFQPFSAGARICLGQQFG